MENWIQRIFLAALLCAGITAWADDDTGSAQRDDQVIQPDIVRRTPEQPEIDKENFEAGLYYGVLSIQDFGSNPVVGASLAYHITEDFFFEGNYGRAKGDQTSFEKLSGGAPLLSSSDREYTYYDLCVGWNVLPGEVFVGSHYAFSSALYLVGGIGSTHFAGDSAFTATVGVGYRLLFTDWLAWHVDARDHLFNSSIFGKTERANNVEFRTGITVFF